MQIQGEKSMDSKFIEEHIMGFYEAGDNVLHRFKSWEYCYQYFQKLKKHQTEIHRFPDLACLHLGFYLASWGMYRGSSYLLKKSYQIHKKTINILMKQEYHALWCKDIDTFTKPETIKSLFALEKALRKAYPNKITSTLVTKIMLGTLGCTPAYDRFFKAGCKRCNVHPYSKFNMRSFEALIKFYNKHYKTFESLAKTICRETGILYPPMKLIDMFFWSVGSGKNYYRI